MSSVPVQRWGRRWEDFEKGEIAFIFSLGRCSPVEYRASVRRFRPLPSALGKSCRTKYCPRSHSRRHPLPSIAFLSGEWGKRWGRKSEQGVGKEYWGGGEGT